jgi:hypothetical protein
LDHSLYVIFKGRMVTAPGTWYRQYLVYRPVPCTAGIHFSDALVFKQ